MAGSPAPLLEVRDLAVDHVSGAGRRRILSGIDLTLNRGDFLALVGASGSGKTTLSHAIVGLLPPTLVVTAGRIAFEGQDLLALGERRLSRLRGRDIGFVPQDPGAALNPVKTISSQLAEVFRLHGPLWGRWGEIRARSIALLDEVGVDRPAERLRQYPHELSGGQKQRVLLAIAFAHRPRLLIADEPTSALDVTVQKQVMAVFDRLVREHGTTVVFVTHDIALAADHASRLLVMRDGAAVEEGAVSRIVGAPRDPYTRLLVSSALPRPSAEPRAASSRAPAEPVLAVEGLAKIFRRSGFAGRGGEAFGAVEDVSFTVRPGSTFALVGESGSGKSTTARAILGLEDASAGRILFKGRDITHAAPRERRLIWRDLQLVHQNPFSSLNPRATIGEIVASPLVAHGIGSRAERATRVADLLAAVGLPPDTAARRPRELSGGQRQRVAIARALAPAADVIILDEALSALDVVTQAQILALLRRLQVDLSLTYVFISHDLRVVRDFADDVGVMRRGRMVEQGPVADVFTRPETGYTRALLDAVPGDRLR